MKEPVASLCVDLHRFHKVNKCNKKRIARLKNLVSESEIHTCSNELQHLSQADELHVKLRILAANFLRFGALLPWFSHHLATLKK
jgi:hypothetical protein